MIFNIDHSLKKVEGVAAKEKELADFILKVSKTRHNLWCENSMWKWLEGHVFIGRYLAEWDMELLRKDMQLRDITQTKRHYLSTVTVGYENNMLSPAEVVKCLDKPSQVIVENAQNDWAVICKWIDLMKNDRTYKDVCTIVCKRKDASMLSYYNAGSCGQIVNSIELCKKVFGGVLPYKVTLLVDSDKSSPSAALSNEKQNILDAMSDYGMDGHILWKREMENYFSEDVYRAARMIDPHATIPNYTPEDWDFMDIENQAFIKYKKKQLPDLVMYLDKPSLLSLVEKKKEKYGGEMMNEIQMLILKFAKLC